MKLEENDVRLERMIDRAVWLHIRQNSKLLLEMMKAAKVGVIEMFDVLYPELPEGSTEEVLVDICMMSIDFTGLRAKLLDLEAGRYKLPK